MRIGIMGGTFNPIHNGHIALGEGALAQFQLDKVWFMPSGLPAHKSNSALLPAKQRLHMVQMAIEGMPCFEASSFEIEREGFTYTADTMVALNAEYPETEFYFIIGGDSLMKFHLWIKPEIISRHAVLIATGRNGYTREELLEQVARLNKQFGTKVFFMDMTDMPVSSNEIRTYCANGQCENIKSLVPEKVYRYIVEQELWKYPTI